ncbi:MAG: hypothetical protein EXR76_06395 [Myxococcales bacterium]|nr:hypothetical protein [Myxococcales bacterium]
MKSERRISREYEGPEVLAELLKSSSCELTVEDVIEEFLAAIEEGSEAAELIPLLWEGEPKFSTPERARRTFSNLFGLWDAVTRNAVGELLMPDQDPDSPLGTEYVDRAWRALDELAEKEQQRARDRFDNVQAELATWVFEKLAPVSQISQEVALDLAFECWFIAEHVRGEGHVVRPTRAALEAALTEADDATSDVEPALGNLVTATLWEQNADEERPLPEVDIPTLERLLRITRRVTMPPTPRGPVAEA